MDWVEDIRLTGGPLYWSAWVLGAAGAAFLLWLPRLPGRRRWLLSVAAALAVTAGLVLLIHWMLIYLTSVFPNDVPYAVLTWVFAAAASLLVLLLRVRFDSWRRRGLDVVAFAAVLLLSTVQVNAYFGLNRTIADLTGTAISRIPALEPALMHQPGTPALPLTGWTAAGTLPDNGVLRTVSIPGTASGLQTRTSYVYLPPAYFAANRPSLPVLVMVPGQPGGPADWLTGGSLLPRMESFADRHGGVAPVVVVVDPNGSQNANNLCMDSDLAKADTYLSVDVPDWIVHTLDVDQDPRQWAVGGFSFGATCAVQMVTRHPDRYTGFLAFASEREPAVAKERQKTIDAAFHGDTEAFDAQLPLTLLGERDYSGKVGYFAAGANDQEFVANMQTLATAASGAGFTVRTDAVQKTGHSWDMLTPGMDNGLELLAQHWGWER
ncbi:alpha/beta hydrolase-fold protein [Arthrobacter sp. UYEF21]|uniref:alpha/beta hydrolase-fold protein n=1 Tax=Arthrobacter sp. UYEF21 TaxID=1756364 RepID=UPI00339ACBA8